MKKNLSNKTLAQILNTKWTGDIPTDEDSSVNRHICRLASFVSAFSLLSNHDFGVI